MTATDRLAKYHADALTFANAIRAQLGYKPVVRLAKGIPANPTACPISETIRGRRDLYVTTTPTEVLTKVIDRTNLYVTVTKDSRRFSIPSHVIDFISHFDTGHYPDLESDR